jgi:hypothetical protein
MESACGLRKDVCSSFLFKAILTNRRDVHSNEISGSLPDWTMLKKLEFM